MFGLSSSTLNAGLFPELSSLRVAIAIHGIPEHYPGATAAAAALLSAPLSHVIVSRRWVGYHHHLFNGAFTDQTFVSPCCASLHRDRYLATYKVEWQFIARSALLSMVRFAPRQNAVWRDPSYPARRLAAAPFSQPASIPGCLHRSHPDDAPEKYCPRVKVPVLSVHSTSIAPKFWNSVQALDDHFAPRHRNRAPLPKLELTPMGGHFRRQPTATAFSANSAKPSYPVSLLKPLISRTTGTMISA